MPNLRLKGIMSYHNDSFDIGGITAGDRGDQSRSV